MNDLVIYHVYGGDLLLPRAQAERLAIQLGVGEISPFPEDDADTDTELDTLFDQFLSEPLS